MKPSADMAPAYTTRRGWRIAMMAAMMNVSSPSSVTRICMHHARFMTYTAGELHSRRLKLHHTSSMGDSRSSSGPSALAGSLEAQ